MSAHDELADLRRRLDAIDRRLLEALAERQEVVAAVAARKAGGGRTIRDAEREQALLGRLVDLGRGLGLQAHLVTRVFREVLDHSLRVQHERIADAADPSRRRPSLRVGFQGGEGAFSHQCAQQHFAARDARVRYLGFPGFRPMLEALSEGRLDYAVLPIENTTAGSINESYDLLADMDLHLVGEEAFKVEHCLIGLPQTNLDDLDRVLSHPVALAQCTRLLSELGCRAEAYEDTALAAAKVAADADPRQVAIASDAAARLHELQVLRRGVQDQRSNFTRMVVVAREAARFDRRIPCKVSVVFATRHERGALARAIAVLAQHELNLTKLESRPRPNTPWEYRFYLDFEGNLDDPTVLEALGQFSVETSYLRVLGCYPTRTSDAARPAAPRRPPVRATPPAATATRVGALTFGDRPLLLAGPASAEELEAAATAARNAGADLLWLAHLDAHDPELLARMEAVGRRLASPLALGVRRRDEVAALAPRADLLVVDADAMHDEALLHEVGRVDCGVVLTRGGTATVPAWIDAADRIRSRGNARVVLLDAGVQTLGRRAPDLAAIPAVAQRYAVLVDVSGTEAGPVLAAAALAAGACGVVYRGTDPKLETIAGLARR